VPPGTRCQHCSITTAARMGRHPGTRPRPGDKAITHRGARITQRVAAVALSPAARGSRGLRHAVDTMTGHV
jgi:hypothetical protein